MVYTGSFLACNRVSGAGCVFGFFFWTVPQLSSMQGRCLHPFYGRHVTVADSANYPNLPFLSPHSEHNSLSIIWAQLGDIGRGVPQGILAEVWQGERPLISVWSGAAGRDGGGGGGEDNPHPDV